MIGTKPRWLRSWDPPGDAETVTICLGHAGSGASAFRGWRPAGVPYGGDPERHRTYCVQLPGREDRFGEEPYVELDRLVGDLVDSWPFAISTPTVLFGHSMGALVAYEAVLRLEAAGYDIAGLVASAHRAPHLPDREPPVHALPRPAFLNALRRLGGCPPEVLEHEQLMDVVLPALRADFQVCETYVGTVDHPPLRCDVTAIGALGDVRVSVDEIIAWEAVTAGQFTAAFIPGGHFAVYDRPDVVRPATGRSA